jgi:hypothetical protein
VTDSRDETTLSVAGLDPIRVVEAITTEGIETWDAS